MHDLVGTSLGPYRVIEQVGQGGMALVYKAYHPTTDRHVALKILLPNLATSPNLLARFEREARVVAKLQHIHILPIFDYGESGGIPYLVMPYVPTGTLKDLLAHGPLELAEAVRLFCQLADAVDYAHREGILHRDLKPGNILMDRSGNVLLSDFGLTRIIEAVSSLTDSGIIGTPAYMSPEQGQGLPVNIYSDIYSLGVILHEMLIGEPPFTGIHVAVILKHVSAPLPSPRARRPDLPESVEKVIFWTLDKRLRTRPREGE